MGVVLPKGGSNANCGAKGPVVWDNQNGALVANNTELLQGF